MKKIPDGLMRTQAEIFHLLETGADYNQLVKEEAEKLADWIDGQILDELIKTPQDEPTREW